MSLWRRLRALPAASPVRVSRRAPPPLLAALLLLWALPAAVAQPAAVAVSAGDVAASASAAAAAEAIPIGLVDDRGRRITLPHAARRIVSLLPSLTETLCALEACDRLVGVDRHSDWPAAVQRLPRLGGLEDTQIERVVALQPDLVLAARSARAVDRLEALGVPVLTLEPQDRAGMQRAIAVVAAALGRPDAGRALLQRIDAQVQAAAARAPPAWHGASVYVEVASTPHAAGAASFVGDLLSRLMLANAVPAALGPFPQLNPEFVLRAQPDLIVASAGELARMPSRPGWSLLRALQTGRHCGLSRDAWNALVRPGPREGAAAEAIVDCLVRLGGPR